MNIKLAFKNITALTAVARMQSSTHRIDPPLNVQIIIDNNDLTFSFFGGHSSIEVKTTLDKLSAKHTGTDKSCSIFTPALHFAKALKNIPIDSKVSLSVTDKNILITAGKRKFKLPFSTDYIHSKKPLVDLTKIKKDELIEIADVHGLMSSNTGYLLFNKNKTISSDSNKRYVICIRDSIASFPATVKHTPKGEKELDVNTSFTMYTSTIRGVVHLIKNYCTDDEVNMAFVIPAQVPSRISFGFDTKQGSVRAEVTLLDDNIHRPMLQIGSNMDALEVSTECLPGTDLIEALSAAMVTEESKLDAVILLSNEVDVSKMTLATPDSNFSDEVAVDTTCQFTVAIRPSHLLKIVKDLQEGMVFRFGTKNRAFLIKKDKVTYAMGCMIDPALGMRYDVKETAVVGKESGNSKEGAIPEPAGSVE